MSVLTEIQALARVAGLCIIKLCLSISISRLLEDLEVEIKMLSDTHSFLNFFIFKIVVTFVITATLIFDSNLNVAIRACFFFSHAKHHELSGFCHLARWSDGYFNVPLVFLFHHSWEVVFKFIRVYLCSKKNGFGVYKYVWDGTRLFWNIKVCLVRFNKTTFWFRKLLVWMNS